MMQAYVYICRNKQRAEYFDDYKAPQSMLFDHSRNIKRQASFPWEKSSSHIQTSGSNSIEGNTGSTLGLMQSKAHSG